VAATACLLSDDAGLVTGATVLPGLTGERPRDRVTHPEWRHAITGSRPGQPVYWAKIFENSYGCWGMLVHW
jgi:predicted RNase H-like nuclease